MRLVTRPCPSPNVWQKSLFLWSRSLHTYRILVPVTFLLSKVEEIFKRSSFWHIEQYPKNYNRPPKFRQSEAVDVFFLFTLVQF